MNCSIKFSVWQSVYTIVYKKKKDESSDSDLISKDTNSNIEAKAMNTVDADRSFINPLPKKLLTGTSLCNLCPPKKKRPQSKCMHKTRKEKTHLQVSTLYGLS
jgi:hypothetical protein